MASSDEALVTLPLYRTEDVVVDPRLVHLPENQSRHIRDDHVVRLQDSFVARGKFDPSEGLMRIIVRATVADASAFACGSVITSQKVGIEREADPHPLSICDESHNPASSATEASTEYIVVDGMHRLTALKKLIAGDVSGFDKIPMSLLTPIESNGFTELEVLTMASHFNQSGHTVATINHADRFFMTMSVLRACQSDPAAVWTPANFAPKLQQLNVLSSSVTQRLSLESVRRYVRVSMSMKDQPKAWQMTLKYCTLHEKAVSVELLVTKAFMQSNEPRKCLMLEAMVFFRSFIAERKGGSVRRKGSMLRSRETHFVIFMEQLLDILAEDEPVTAADLDNERGKIFFKAVTQWPSDPTEATYKVSTTVAFQSLRRKLQSLKTGEHSTVDEELNQEQAISTGIHTSSVLIPGSSQGDLNAKDSFEESHGLSGPATSTGSSDHIQENNVSGNANAPKSPETECTGRQAEKPHGDRSDEPQALGISGYPPDGSFQAPGVPFLARSSDLPSENPVASIRSSELRKRHQTSMEEASSPKRSAIQRSGSSSRPSRSQKKKKLEDDHGGSDDDENDEDHMFDDTVENPCPTSAFDPSVEKHLPSFNQKSRAKYYLSMEELDSIKSNILTRSFTWDVPELHFNGFVILESLFDKNEIGEAIESLLTHFRNKFSGPMDARKKPESDPWLNIVNANNETDRTNATKRVGRMSVDKRALTDDLENENPELYKKKLLIEVALGLLMQKLTTGLSLRVENEQPIAFPLTGLRILMTAFSGKDPCPRQTPHTDFKPKVSGTEEGQWSARENPSYFIMVSGGDSFPIYVWPQSHSLGNGNGRVVRRFSAEMPCKIITVPPYSVFVGRGDLVHAGAGSEQETRKSTMPMYNTRIHMYAIRACDFLLDAIYLPADYKFRYHD
jgi:hypothetical protein